MDGLSSVVRLPSEETSERDEPDTHRPHHQQYRHDHHQHHRQRQQTQGRHRSRSRESGRNGTSHPQSSHHHSYRRVEPSSTSHIRQIPRSPSSRSHCDRHFQTTHDLSAKFSARTSQLDSVSRKEERAKSPGPVPGEDIVAERAGRSFDEAPRPRRRSPLADQKSSFALAGGRSAEVGKKRARRVEDDVSRHHHRRRSPRRATDRTSRSRSPHSRRGRDQGEQRSQYEDLHTRGREDRLYADPSHGGREAGDRTRSGRESRDIESGRARSLSKKNEDDRDSEMYNRGAPYDPRYGGRPPAQSPYGSHGYPNSGSPSHSYTQQSPYPSQQTPSQSATPYYQPQPGKQYGGSPNAAAFPPREPRQPQRGGPAARGGRAHYANLSWTPGDGVKGGHLVQPGDKPKEGSSGPSAPQPKSIVSVVSVPDLEEDDNPFRPPADLRAEDESSRKKRKTEAPTSTASTPVAPKSAKELAAQAEREKNKISFSIKGRATRDAADKTPAAPKPETSPLVAKRTPLAISPLVQNNAAAVPKSSNYVGNTRVNLPSKPSPAPPAFRKEVVKKKRLKPRPQLTEEFAQSDSVYYRKTGNESVVGSGTYGKVYKAIHVYTGGMVALKKIRMEGERDGFPVTAIREIKLLQSLTHPNIVALLEVMVERNDCFMVFEYLSHDLTGLLNHPTFALTAAHKKHLAKQLFEGLDYLHRRGVLHRDIKAANILVSNKGELKLADFGLARFYQKRQKQDYTNRVITIWYRSPELLLGETQYGPAVDIWSAACVLVEIFTRHAIFPGDGGEINQLDKIYNVLGTPSRSEWPGITELQWYELLRPSHRIVSTFEEKYRERVSPEAFELLQAMFLYDPANRPTASDVLEHPYFTAEEPKPAQVVELEALEGDWHEFESKALRKEKERQDREARRRDRETEKRKADEPPPGDGAEMKKSKPAEAVE